MNEINITLEGKEYQIDIQKAKELGVLKEKNPRCKSWEEFKLKYYTKQGFYYNDINEKIESINTPIKTTEQLTENEAIAIKAFSKLLKLRRNWIGNWEPDWHSSESKYCIINMNDKFQVSIFQSSYHIFSFPTEKMAEEFIECFKELFKQAYA